MSLGQQRGMRSKTYHIDTTVSGNRNDSIERSQIATDDRHDERRDGRGDAQVSRSEKLAHQKRKMVDGRKLQKSPKYEIAWR